MQGSGRSRNRCAGRVDVVDEDDGARDWSRGRKRSTHVRLPLGAIEPGLPAARTSSRKELCALERPAHAKLASQPLRRMVAALELPRGIGRDIRDDVCHRSLDVSGDEVGGNCRDAAETVLLPPVDERARRPGVGNRRACRGEREPAPGTFAAPLDRPRRRGAAAPAPRRWQETQLRAAGEAKGVGSNTTRRAAARQEKIDEPRRSRYVAERNVSVPAL
jgi:hypothetical protein